MKFIVWAILSVTYAASAAVAAQNPVEATATSPAFGLEWAQKIVSRAVACGVQKGWKLSVAVVNGEGNLIAFQRMDGSYVGSIEAAIGKATSANAFHRPTSQFVEAVRNGNLGLLSVKGVVANAGGVPIVVGGKTVGAVGISGAVAVEDEKCAIAALE